MNKEMDRNKTSKVLTTQPSYIQSFTTKDMTSSQSVIRIQNGNHLKVSDSDGNINLQLHKTAFLSNLEHQSGKGSGSPFRDIST